MAHDARYSRRVCRAAELMMWALPPPAALLMELQRSMAWVMEWEKKSKAEADAEKTTCRRHTQWRSTHARQHRGEGERALRCRALAVVIRGGRGRDSLEMTRSSYLLKPLCEVRGSYAYHEVPT
jgi:hypothetical protein